MNRVSSVAGSVRESMPKLAKEAAAPRSCGTKPSDGDQRATCGSLMITFPLASRLMLQDLPIMFPLWSIALAPVFAVLVLWPASGGSCVNSHCPVTSRAQRTPIGVYRGEPSEFEPSG